MSKPIVSDQLGCTMHEVDAVRADAQAHGFTGIEFKPDPALVENGQALYFDCHAAGPAEYERYKKHCGVTNYSKRARAVTDSDQLAAGAGLLLRQLEEKLKRQNRDQG